MGSGETIGQNGTGGLPPRRSRRRKAGRKPVSKLARGMRTALRAFVVLFVLAVTAGAIYVGVLWKQVDDTLDKISGDDPPADEQGEDHQAQPKPKEKPVTLLIFGLDTRSASRSLNTDVIMVAALNPEQKKGTLVSIPRDMAMAPTGYKQDKANAFYAVSRRYGKDKPGGPDALVKAMFGELLDVPVDYLVTVNFQTFEDVVDALGGIEVDVDMDMCYEDSVDGTKINLKKGRQTLGGKEALDFVRYRQSSDSCGEGRTKESSDLARNKRQQQVVKAILDKTMSLGGVAKAGSLLKAVGDNVQTDIPKDKIVQLITTYATLSSADLETITLEGDWQSPYIIVPRDRLQAARDALKARLEGDALPEGVARTEIVPPEAAFSR